MKRSYFCAFCDSKDPVAFIAGLGLCQHHLDRVNVIRERAEKAAANPPRRARKPTVRRSPTAAEASR